MFEKNWKQLGDSEAGEDFFGVSLSITLGFKIQPARSRTRHWGRHAQDVLGIQQEHQLVDVNGEPLLRRGTCLDAWLVSAVKGGLGCENLVESIQKKNICWVQAHFSEGKPPNFVKSTYLTYLFNFFNQKHQEISA